MPNPTTDEPTPEERARDLWIRLGSSQVENEEVGLYHERMRAMIAAEIRAAVAAEREQCAKIADQSDGVGRHAWDHRTGIAIAAAIRADADSTR